MSDLAADAGPPRRRLLLMSGACGAAAVAARAGSAPLPKEPTALQLKGPRTVLVLIDLQNSNANEPFSPISFAEVVANSLLLAHAVRRSGGMVAYTRVIVQQLAKLPTDVQLPAAPATPNGDDLVASAGFQRGDTLITKRQFGAFYGTGLHDRLRRHGMTTIILAGVATELGVDSTARAALDRRYALVFARDAVSGVSANSNTMVLDDIFPLFGRVRTTSEIVASLTP